MMKTAALVTLVAIGSLSASRAMEVPAVTAGASCTQNAPSDVENPAGAIISGTTCLKCLGTTETFFDIDDYGMEVGEDSAGCYCEDGTECVSWEASETEVNPLTFFDDE